MSATHATSQQQPRGWITKDEWTKYIQENPAEDCGSPPSIFRVPNFLKGSNREEYVPKRVSLGPYHHRSEELHPINPHKGRAVERRNLRSRSDLVKDEILKLENQIRASYDEKIMCDGETLALMLSLDGCFFLEILHSLRGPARSSCYEPVFDNDKIEYTGMDIEKDILKLENQIPFIVFHKILELEDQSSSNVRKQLLELCRKLWCKVCPFVCKFLEERQLEERQLQRDLEAHHLLDLFHSWIGLSQIGEGSTSEEDASPTLPPSGHEATNSLEEGAPLEIIHRAVDLRKAGIHFRHCDIDHKHTHLEGNTLYLPQITIDDYTETLLRNLIAFEMCKPSKSNIVSCYVYLMDGLIDSAEDVALLRRQKIITNYIGSDTEVAELFNGICKGVTTDSEEDPFKHLKQHVNAYYENKKYRWFAQLVNEHFSTPWKALALAGAIILLLLTIVQTICSILSVIHDK